MGREEVMASTRAVSASTCCLTYAAAVGIVGYSFAASELPGGRSFRAGAKAVLGDAVDDDSYWVGFYAMCAATTTIYAFSFLCSNSSLYDPAWCVLPIAVASSWMMQGSGSGGGGTPLAIAMPSARAAYGLAALLLWFARYHAFFPWSGWTQGIATEERLPSLP